MLHSYSPPALCTCCVYSYMASHRTRISASYATDIWCMYLLQPLIPWCTTNPTSHLLADGWGVALLHRMLLSRISTACSSYYSCSISPHATSVHAARIRYSTCGLAGSRHSDQPLAAGLDALAIRSHMCATGVSPFSISPVTHICVP